MCGLVGVASVSPQSDRGWITTARDTLAHRGPDDAGEWWSEDGRVGLAHRRLSIIDLSSAGHQPMHSRQRGLSIVFNGEIYNFRDLRVELESIGHAFKTNSDTEVILAAYDAWGTDCLQRLKGMFAFSIFDANKRRLFIARDRAGEKPLFYHLADKTIYFASELKALMANPALPRRIDPTALDCYLAMGYVPGDRCILRGFSKLPPAHSMQFDLVTGNLKVWRYWQIPDLDPVAGSGPADEAFLLDELERLLEESVGSQLVADVPVGVLLSGGVDSSLVTAMAARHSGSIQTFTVGFPGSGSLDETKHARLVAQHFGTEHIELMAEPTTAETIPHLAQQFDEPMADSSMIPTWLVSRVVRQHCRVVLGGDGGDELFGGYGTYNKRLWMQQRIAPVPPPLRRLVTRAAEQLLPPGFFGGNVRSWLIASGSDLRRGLPIVANLFDPVTRRDLMADFQNYSLAAEAIWQDSVPEQEDPVQRATRMDFMNYLPEDILVKVDRASMLASVEMRAPFLDDRMIDFAFGKVPTHLKVAKGGRKILLKRLAAKLLPEEFDQQRKQGFSIPLSTWLNGGPFRDLFWGVLNDPGCVFESKTVRRLLQGQDKGRCNGERLYSMVHFELWRRHYDVSW